MIDSLNAALLELLLFLFAVNMLLVPFLRSAPFFLLTHSIEGDKVLTYTVYSLFFQL